MGYGNYYFCAIALGTLHKFLQFKQKSLKEYVPAARRPAFTRFNVFLRDAWECQYCGDRFRTQELTFDHVIPRSRGGITSWDNIVTACRCCNTKKGHRMPHECSMYPQHKPMQPSVFELQEKGRKFPPNFLHESWGDFLYWDSELESEEDFATR